MNWRATRSDLPPGWAWATVGEVADVDLGKMLDRKKQTGEHAMTYLRNVNVRWHEVELDDLLTMDVAPDVRDRYTVRVGDLLICEGGEPGRCAIVPPSADGLAYQKALHRVRPHEGVDVQYLSYLFEAMVALGHIAGETTGSTISHLPRERLVELPVPLAPAREQQRIAQALAAQVSLIEAAAGGVKNLVAKTDALRATLRRAAVTGKLAGTGGGAQELTRQAVIQRRNVHVSRRLKDIAPGPCPVTVPASWTLVSLSDLAWDIDYGTSTKCDYSGRGMPVLRIPNVVDGRIETADLKRAVDATLDLSGSAVSPGDVLVVRTNGSRDLIGRCGEVEASEELAFASYLIRFRLLTEVVDPGWVVLVLSSPHWRQLLERRAATTAGQYNLSIGKLADVPIPLPPLDEQRRLLAELRDSLSGLEKSQADTAAQSRMVSALRRALLQAAFTGQLVEQDPSDEPAELLLKAIAEERANKRPASGGQRRTVRKTRTSRALKSEETSA